MPNATLTRAIDALADRRDLSADETAEVLDEIMHGEASETQIAGFLVALRTKGETVEELTGLARTMRALAAHVPSGRDDLLDTAGTGGGRRTFNVSTTAALIAAGAECAVAKHGNRSATSSSGSADVLEALGARIDLDPEAGPADRGGARGSPEHNAGPTRAILDPGTSAEASASRELAVINAGAAIYAAGAAGSLAQGVQAARAAIADGSAARALERYVQASIELAPAERAS